MKFPSALRTTIRPATALRPRSLRRARALAHHGCSGHERSGHERSGHERPGTVLILVVGVLAMLFIIGASLLVVSSFERETATRIAEARNLKSADSAVVEPIILQLYYDIKGNDNTPYNFGYSGDNSASEDFADFAGFVAQQSLSNGDLMFSSLEPYRFNNGGPWYLFATSWGLDSSYNVGLRPVGNQVGISLLPVDGGILRDADADGVYDSSNSVLLDQLRGMFGQSMRLELRVLPHGGMVMLDPFTHPALLTQVIHPKDSAYHATPIQLWTDGLAVEIASDENNLRRRYMLPPNVDRQDLPSTALENLLPNTLGYLDPTGDFNDCTPHYWVLESDQDNPCMNEWWTARMSQPYPLTHANYNADNDGYDRRHLMTVAKNYDDILRPIRDEARLDNLFSSFFTTNYVAALNPVDGSPTPIPGTSPVQYYDYGYVDGSLEFNSDSRGGRVQFSLRDVLEPNGEPNGEASYRRVMQLAAYFMAMIQHTSVAGSDSDTPYVDQLIEQLRTAVQLAINTVDFADQDQNPTRVTLYNTGGQQIVDMVGVEKHPYLTEAYAKVVIGPEDATTWKDEPDWDQTIYAIEFYNPYSEPIDLSMFELVDVVYDKNTKTTVDLDLGWIPMPAYGPDAFFPGSPAVEVDELAPYSYIVITNRQIDPLLQDSNHSWNSVHGSDAYVAGAVPDENFFVIDDTNLLGADQVLHLEKGMPVKLRMKDSAITDLTGDAMPPGGVIVDVLDPDRNMHAFRSNLPFANDEKLTTDLRTPGEIRGTNPQWEPGDYSEDYLVYETTMLRRKEMNAFTADNGQIIFPPLHWYFTLSLQSSFPLYEDINLSPSNVYPMAEVFQSYAWDGRDNPPIHNLLGTQNYGTLAGERDYQDLLEDLFAGKGVNSTPLNVAFVGLAQGGNSTRGTSPPVAPFPILTADRGVRADTGGTLAFPTTGTLALVTRYAHDLRCQSYSAGVRATQRVDANWCDAVVDEAEDLAQMRQVDNGHLPLFDDIETIDDSQIVMDLARGQGRLNVPWGQLIYEYFTALPLEELVRDGVPLASVGGGLGELVASAAYDSDYAALFPGYPIVEPVEVGGDTTVGPRVRGRININFAPWWVLDGMPMMFDDYLDTANLQANPDQIALSLPVRELFARTGGPPLDQPGSALNIADLNNAATRPGERFLDLLVDDFNQDATYGTALPTPSGFTDMGPDLAKYLVSYREPVLSASGSKRIPRQAAGSSPISRAWEGTNTVPGFATVGEIADVLAGITVKAEKGSTLEGNLLALRDATLSNDKPFAYLGYLHLVAPMVRLQDWATTRSHVYTIYSTVGSSGVTFRSQVTVDRSRCLYSNDLPVRIAESEPISYFNTLDQ